MRTRRWFELLTVAAVTVSLAPTGARAQESESPDLGDPQPVNDIGVCYEYSGPAQQYPDGFRFTVVPADGTTIGPVGSVSPKWVGLPFGTGSADDPVDYAEEAAYPARESDDEIRYFSDEYDIASLVPSGGDDDSPSLSRIKWFNGEGFSMATVWFISF